MHPSFLIARREFTENAKTKGFWFSILLFPAIWILTSQVPLLLDRKATPSRLYVLVDPQGEWAPVIRKFLDFERNHQIEEAFGEFVRRNARESAVIPEFKDDGQPFNLEKAKERVAGLLKPGATSFLPPRERYREASLPSEIAKAEPLAHVEAELRLIFRGEKKLGEGAGNAPLFAAILIPKTYGVDEASAIHYWCDNQADTGLRDEVERAISSEMRRREWKRTGVELETVRRVEKVHAKIESFNPKKAEGDSRVGLSDQVRQWAPSAFVYLLWVAIFAIVQMLLNSVIEEKSNRVVEVLLSSVTPSQLMVGKLAGIAAIGLVMVSLWLGTLGLMVWWKTKDITIGAIAANGVAGSPVQVAEILRSTLQHSWLLPAFVLYFFLGYILYAALILALGATCNTIKESQNYMGVIVMFMMVPLLAVGYIPRDPNGTLATVLSWIPIYTPFAMMNRITSQPPVRDVVGTLVLLLAFTAFALWGCGKVFRAGILRTGQPPRWREIVGWLRQPAE